MAEAQANVMVKDATPKKVMALASRKYSRDDKIQKDQEDRERQSRGFGPMGVQERFERQQQEFTGFDSSGNFVGFYVGGVPTKPMKPQRLKQGGLAKMKVKPKRMKKGGLASRKK